MLIIRVVKFRFTSILSSTLFSLKQLAGNRFLRKAGTVELHLPGSWFFGSSINPDRLGPSGIFVGNSTKITYLVLLVIGSGTVEYYGFWNFKLGVVERFRRR
jgi:hypothetical protein